MMKAQDVSEIHIRERAYHLWTRAGRPENESFHFWDKAREQLVLESTPDPTIQETLMEMSQA